jgi:PEP-CTERM motif
MNSTAPQFISLRASRAALSSTFALLAAFGGWNQAWADPGMTNLAAGMTATSTRSDFGGTPDKAVDGNRDGNFGDGSVFYENADPTPGATSYFYQVDLGQNNYVNRVQFLPRTDADQNIFGNFNISIFPDNGTGNPAAIPSFSQNYNSSYFGDSFATVDPGAAAPGGANGRFVRITRLDNNYWMTFAEMEVIGSPTPLQYTEADNIAVGKPVTTSSPPGFGAVITAGNDGNITGDFNAGSVYHSSNHGIGEYWQVDLGADKPLAYADLFARTSINSTSEFKLSVLDSLMNVVDSVIVDNSDVTGPTPGYDHTIDLTGVTGKFIRLETTGDSYLAFSELQVFAAQVPEPATLVMAVMGLCCVLAVSARRRKPPSESMATTACPPAAGTNGPLSSAAGDPPRQPY